MVAGVLAVAVLVGARLLSAHGTSGPAAPTGAPARSTTAPPTTTPPAGALSTTTSPALGAAARGGLRFTDVTRAAGLAAPHASHELVGDDEVMTGGAAVGDYDGDGDQDVYLTRVGLPNRLLRNDGHGHFTDVAAQAGVTGSDPTDGYADAVWADVNGDGHLDLFVTAAGRGANLLYINDGHGHFTDQAAARGLAPTTPLGLLGNESFGAAFDDWDHDGDLDLVVLQWYVPPFTAQLQVQHPALADADLCGLAAQRRAQPDPARPESRTTLYRNDGTGHFTDVTAASGLRPDQLVGFQPVFADVDGDGWDDLLVTGDVCTSRLYRNEHGHGFTDVTAAAHVGTDENGMGSVVEDVDGDGHLDWFVTGISYPTGDGRCPRRVYSVGCSGNRLYLGDGRGHFTDATDRFGVRDAAWGWGAAAQDLNDDGRRDLVVVNGMHDAAASRAIDPGPPPSTGATAPSRPTGTAPPDVISARSDHDPSRLWVATASRPWPEAAQALGLTDRLDSKGVVAFDADGDGDLDLLEVNTNGDPILYRNDTPPSPASHWLTLRLRQPRGANRFAIGATVLVTPTAGATPEPLEVHAGGSFETGDPTDLHVGLGSVATVARIEVRWPGDPTPQVLTDVAADQVLQVDRTDRTG